MAVGGGTFAGSRYRSVVEAPARSHLRPLVEPRQRVWFAHAIRGPACLLVVFTHLFDLFPNAQTLVAQIAHFQPVTGLPTVPWLGVLGVLGRNRISTGALGVLLFFLVSGFVIPFSLESGNPRGFFVRRFFRLYPTMWICLLVTALMLTAQSHFQGTPPPFGKRMLGANAFLVSPYMRQPWIEPVFWSLAVEELFYLIAATAAWRGLLASRTFILLAAVGLTSICLVATNASPGGLLFSVGFNAVFVIFILIGVVFHYLHQGTWGRVESLVICAVTFVLWIVAVHNAVPATLAAAYTFSSVVALVLFGVLYLVRARLPYSRVLDWLSNISYPLYLLHGVNGYLVIRIVYVVTGNYYLGAAAAAAVSLLGATAVHYFVETPTNNMGRRLSKRLQTPGATADSGAADSEHDPPALLQPAETPGGSAD